MFQLERHLHPRRQVAAGARLRAHGVQKREKPDPCGDGRCSSWIG